MRVAIAEDNSLFRTSLARYLREAGQEVVVTAATGTELLAGLTGQAADVAILDVRMPPGELGGLTTARQLRALYPTIGLLFLSNHHEPYVIRQAVPEHMPQRVGYWTKDGVQDVESLLTALTTIAHGQVSIEPKLLPTVLSTTRHPIEQLTARERQVLGRVAAGASSRDIADGLCVTPKTVEGYLSSIYRKLDIEAGRDGNSRVRASAFYDHYRRTVLPPN